MDLFTHYALGLFLTKVFDTPWTIFFSIIFDIDHLLGYIYDKKKKGQEIQISRITHLLRRKRTWLHSFWGIFLLTVMFSYFFNPVMIITCALFHLVLDSVDKAGIQVLSPLIKRKFKGPLPIAYVWENPEKKNTKKASGVSLMFTLIFLVLFFYT